MKHILERAFWIAFAVCFGLLLGSVASAGDSNTLASGEIVALDVNQGSGTQVNGDVWEDMDSGIVGSGNLAWDIEGPANTGSGEQDNSQVDAADWRVIGDANAGSGSQVRDSVNSNGLDRVSNDAVIVAGSLAAVSHSDLASQVSGNSVSVGQGAYGGKANSSIRMNEESGFNNMYGVNAIALSAGANASQNVSVNVTASVSAAGSR